MYTTISVYDENQKFLENNLARINKVFPVHTSIVLERKTVENEQEQDTFLEKARFIRDVGSRDLLFMIYFKGMKWKNQYSQLNVVMVVKDLLY